MRRRSSSPASPSTSAASGTSRTRTSPRPRRRRPRCSSASATPNLPWRPRRSKAEPQRHAGTQGRPKPFFASFVPAWSILFAVPICSKGIGRARMAGTRIETDSLGEIEVPADALWGAQTERSRRFFRIGDERMPVPVVRALGVQKKAAALANMALGVLDKKRGDAIVAGADAVIAGALDDQFPLVIWQTGSGTKSNMNANEVIANWANRSLGGALGAKSPVH